jgi:hypothetical protein
MKLKSAVLINNLKITLTQLKTTVTVEEYQAIKMTAESGNFMLFAEYIDTFYVKDGIGASDGAILALFKVLSDNASITDDSSLTLGKGAADTISVVDDGDLVRGLARPVFDTAFITDPISKEFSTAFANGASVVEDAASLEAGKGLSEAPSVADQLEPFAFGKNPSDTPAVTDVITARALTKSLANLVDATDDIDGAATTQDDQELQFAKVTTNTAALTDALLIEMTFNRAFAETFGVTDGDVLNFGKRPSETTSMTDAGSLRNQGYADFTYFQEDYVGASRTF